MNCAGLTPETAISELFGHVKGSFTGAHTDKEGLFKNAETAAQAEQAPIVEMRIAHKYGYYIASLDDKADSSLLVSCCDKLHNARSIHRDFARLGDLFWERFNSDRQGIEWYYRSLAEKFLQRRIAPAVELEIVVESTFS